VCVSVNAEALGPEHWHGVKFSALTGSLPLSLYLALLFLHQLIAVSVFAAFQHLVLPFCIKSVVTRGIYTRTHTHQYTPLAHRYLISYWCTRRALPLCFDVCYYINIINLRRNLSTVLLRIEQRTIDFFLAARIRIQGPGTKEREPSSHLCPNACASDTTLGGSKQALA
jgi:hypothetical protein